MLTYETFLFAGLVFLLAGMVKGVIGFGVNVVCIPAMALVLGGHTGARDAVALVSIVTVLNNVLLVASWRKKSYIQQIRRIWLMLAFGVVGVIVGSILLVKLDGRIVTFVLGLLTVIYVLTDRIRKNWHIPPDREKTIGPVAGLASGLLSGVSGVATPVLVAYLFNLRLTRSEFVYVISVIFILYNGLQALSYWGLGLYRPEIVLYSVGLLIPVMGGTYLGAYLQNKVSQLWFNRLVLGGLLIIGLDLIRGVLLS